jgi:hypothetical protein
MEEDENYSSAALSIPGVDLYEEISGSFLDVGSGIYTCSGSCLGALMSLVVVLKDS